MNKELFPEHDLFDDEILGQIIGGSLSRGLDVRISSPGMAEKAKVGTFVTIQGRGRRFFGIITDLLLDSSDSRLASVFNTVDTALADVLVGTSTHIIARVTPMLSTAISGASDPEPAKSLPAHFSISRFASNADVQSIFGSEDERHIWIGSPLDMEDTKVCLDLFEFVKRSNGVFGKSGSGKSFLTRILLAGILQHDVATNLVFDMHNEYGWQGNSENGHKVKGLKQLFPSKVSVFTLDSASSRQREVAFDKEVSISYSEIQPEDIELLSLLLEITPFGVDACFLLRENLGNDWLSKFLSIGSNKEPSKSDDARDSISEVPRGIGDLAENLQLNTSTLQALYRRLLRLKTFEFITNKPRSRAINDLMVQLIAGKHVVLEFGKWGSNLTAYLLVANLLTRKIHEEYRQLTEHAISHQKSPPQPLVITVEEAHRFLSKDIAGKTIFGTIAREMRKYHVTLLVVDQRPSGIDEEVLSQVGTKVTCQLDNERDIDALLTGLSGTREMKSVLSRLESNQQALLFGHALPMPVVVRTRQYDSAFYESVSSSINKTVTDFDSDRKSLFG